MEEIDPVENLIDQIIVYGWRMNAAGKTEDIDPDRAEDHVRIAEKQIRRIRDLLERPF